MTLPAAAAPRPVLGIETRASLCSVASAPGSPGSTAAAASPLTPVRTRSDARERPRRHHQRGPSVDYSVMQGRHSNDWLFSLKSWKKLFRRS